MVIFETNIKIYLKLVDPHYIPIGDQDKVDQ